MQAAVGGGIRITDGRGQRDDHRHDDQRQPRRLDQRRRGCPGQSGGLDVDGSLLLVDSRVDRNTCAASVPPSSGNLASAAFGGIEVRCRDDPRQQHQRQRSQAFSATGPAIGGGGGLGNHRPGDARAGARDRQPRQRRGRNRAPFLVGGGNNGGGILNTTFGGVPPELTLSDSVVAANALTATTGIAPRAAGSSAADVFTGDPSLHARPHRRRRQQARGVLRVLRRSNTRQSSHDALARGLHVPRGGRALRGRRRLCRVRHGQPAVGRTRSRSCSHSRAIRLDLVGGA